MKVTSWQTQAAGLATITCALWYMRADDQPKPEIVTALIASGLGNLRARQNDIPSERVGVAPRKA